MTPEKIAALPLSAFFPKGRPPFHYRDGKLIATVNGVEHDAEELLKQERICTALEARVSTLTRALERIEALDEAMGHELTVDHAFEAVAIAREALNTSSGEKNNG